MAVVEGPFRYVVEAEGGEDACGVPGYPSFGPDYLLRYATNERFYDLSLDIRLVTSQVGPVRVARSRGGNPRVGLTGTRYAVSELPLRVENPESSVDDCFRRYYGGFPSQQDLSNMRARGPRAFTSLDYWELLLIRGEPPESTLAGGVDVPAPDRPYESFAVVYLVPPRENVYVLADEHGVHMTLAEAQRLEAAQVQVQLAHGVSHIPGTPEIELEGTSDIRVVKNGAGFTSHANWPGVLANYLYGRRLPGAVYFEAGVDGSGVSFQMRVVPAAIPAEGLGAKKGAPPIFRLADGVEVRDRSYPSSSVSHWELRWPNRSPRARIKALGASLRISDLSPDGTERVVATVDFSRFSLELYINLYSGELRGGRFRPDFGGLDIRLGPYAPEWPSQSFRNRLIALVRA